MNRQSPDTCPDLCPVRFQNRHVPHCFSIVMIPHRTGFRGHHAYLSLLVLGTTLSTSWVLMITRPETESRTFCSLPVRVHLTRRLSRSLRYDGSYRQADRRGCQAGAADLEPYVNGAALRGHGLSSGRTRLCRRACAAARQAGARHGRQGLALQHGGPKGRLTYIIFRRSATLRWQGIHASLTPHSS